MIDRVEGRPVEGQATLRWKRWDDLSDAKSRRWGSQWRVSHPGGNCRTEDFACDDLHVIKEADRSGY